MVLDRRSFIKAVATMPAVAVMAPYVARAATRTLRVGYNNTATSGPGAGAIAFQRYVSDQTDKRYVVEIYPNAQLGSDTQQVKAVADGTLDMTIPSTAALGSYNRDIELVEIPYLFKDLASARAALDGNLGAYYTESLQKSGLTNLAWGENGVRHMTANKPVRSVADLKGLKMRVQASKIQVESFVGLGAAAEPLTFSELAEALRTGRFEAQENPISIIVANDFFTKTQSHLSLTGHVYTPFAVLFSSDVLEDMTPADRAVIKAGGAAAAKATRDFNENAVANGIDKLKAGGMTIVTDVDRPAIQKAMEGLNDRLAAVAGADAIARVRGLIA